MVAGIYVALEGKAVVTFKVLGETRTKEEKVVREEVYIIGKNIRKRQFKFSQIDIKSKLISRLKRLGKLFMPIFYWIY